jgi:alpha-tubulin suppressor-like RCC1 family protein
MAKLATYTVRITVSPVQSPVITTIVSGFSHVMAVKNDGTVWACGDNSSSQFGLGDYSGRNRLTQVPVYDVDQISSGDAATIIKLKDGTTWGAGNRYGQLGLGNTKHAVFFTRTPFLDDAIQFAITFNEVFALKKDGTVWGAGWNIERILLQGDNELRPSFVKIPVSDVKRIFGKFSDIIVQKNNGELWGWGTNASGYLGVGDNQPRKSPVLIPTPPAGVAQVFAGSTTVFLLDNAGKVWSTGANFRGQLSLGDQAVHTSFTQVAFFNSKSVDAIIPHSVSASFRETNGNVWNVGDNVYGQIGLGTVSTLPVLTPVLLPGFSAKVLAGSGNTTFALKADGTLWAWGSNSAGALGNGPDLTYSSSPIQIK